MASPHLRWEAALAATLHLPLKAVRLPPDSANRDQRATHRLRTVTSNSPPPPVSWCPMTPSWASAPVSRDHNSDEDPAALASMVSPSVVRTESYQRRRATTPPPHHHPLGGVRKDDWVEATKAGRTVRGWIPG